MASETISDIDRGEELVNYRYGLAIMKQLGDVEGLAREKRLHPAEYADWERRTAMIEQGKKTETE